MSADIRSRIRFYAVVSMSHTRSSFSLDRRTVERINNSLQPSQHTLPAQTVSTSRASFRWQMVLRFTQRSLSLNLNSIQPHRAVTLANEVAGPELQNPHATHPEAWLSANRRCTPDLHQITVTQLRTLNVCKVKVCTLVVALIISS